MDKKSITGIAIVAVLFLGFAYFNSKQQEKYQRELAAYQARQDSLAALNAPVRPAPAPDSTSLTAGAPDDAAMSMPEAEYRRRSELLGDALAEAHAAEAAEIVAENDVMKVTFSTRGGQVTDVVLKDYTRYAPRGERNEPIRLFDPESARFNMQFYIRNLRNQTVPVNTMDYVFRAEPVQRAGDAQRIVMRLPVADGSALVYEYTLYDSKTPSRDYLVDLRVRMENMGGLMANQTTVGIDWSNTSYQNEKGFKNENMYTTLSYRFPGESSIEDLGMSEESKSKEVTTKINWVAFKQQFFSSVFIAGENMQNAKLAFDTAKPGSDYLKNFSARMTVPYSMQTEGYDFAFYFGPNKYSILKQVVDGKNGELHLERLIPLGWGIFGWVNRWCVIPVFDFLRNYISSFGIIILILAVLIKLVISPLTYKSYISSAKMRVIKPEVDALAKKFPKQEDAMKKQQATMELYKKAGINPMGGCIPFLWADDLSSYDSVWNLPFSIPFYGDHVSLFALLMTVTLFVFSYFNYQQTASSQPQMAGMKFMMVYLMPIMMLFWFNNYSSGLCYYYFLSTLISIVQTLVIRRMIDDEKIHAIMKANAAKRTNGKKSKFQQRYEELMREQQARRK